MKSESLLVNAARQQDTRTANGAVTNSTSLNSVVDMFFLAGASRDMSEQEILRVWTAAFVEDSKLAFRCLFWARDVRGGAGERRFFRVIWNSLSTEKKAKYMKFVAEYGRYDDLYRYDDPTTAVMDYIVELLKAEDTKNLGLLCKWLPRKGPVAEYLRKKLGWDPKRFRKFLVNHTNVVEQLMSAKNWSEIEYKSVPSQAFNKYKKAFARNDEERFNMFIEKDASEIKSSTLFPYQLFQSYCKGERQDVINAQWDNLPDYVGEGKSFIPVCDVSGSMNDVYSDGLTPMDISVSLGVYLSERNKSIFRDAFITFSGSPRMEYLQGSACERFNQLSRAHWEMNTDLQAVFQLILHKAIEGRLSADDMPETIIIISDMEFDSCVSGLRNYDAIKEQYEDAGYPLPNVVFWNAKGRPGNVPVKYDQRGTALVSGASPAIVKALLGGEDMTPVGIMLKTLNSERYSAIE